MCYIDIVKSQIVGISDIQVHLPESHVDLQTITEERITENPVLDLSRVRYLTVGAESGVDHSKPVSSYVAGMLQSAGVELPRSLTSFQVQHACAGETRSLRSAAASLRAAGRSVPAGLSRNVVACPIGRSLRSQA